MPSDVEGAGLMAFWSDIDADYLYRYQQWHNCEHMPERVTTPGFLRGCRYRALDCSAHFLMFYETREPAVFKSDYYLNALNHPTPWTQEALTHFRNPVRNIYRLGHVAGTRARFTAPFMTSLRFNSSAPDALPAWVDALGAQPHVQRVRLYHVDEEISQIMTSERKIYSGGPGAQQFLAMIETGIENAALPALNAVERQSLQNDVYLGQYWLEMMHEDPEERTGD